MAADTTNSTSPPLPAEPFGQTGVRQYLGVLINGFLITGLIITCLLWYQSYQSYARFEWRKGAEELRITSVYGRIRIDGMRYAHTIHPDGGWSFRTGRVRQPRDGWKESLWKWIGIELSWTPEFSASEGFWLRIKWSFLAMLCGLILSIRLFFHWQHQQQERE